VELETERQPKSGGKAEEKRRKAEERQNEKQKKSRGKAKKKQGKSRINQRKQRHQRNQGADLCVRACVLNRQSERFPKVASCRPILWIGFGIGGPKTAIGQSPPRFWVGRSRKDLRRKDREKIEQRGKAEKSRENRENREGLIDDLVYSIPNSIS
jgi:hypothetical protein